MRATKNQFSDFVQSVMWEDLKKILLLRRSEIRDTLEEGSPADIDPQTEMRESARLRGRSEELKYIVDLPQLIVDNYDEFNREEEEE